MATFADIGWMREINDTEAEKVNELVESLLKKGWQGAPILFHSEWGLVTGSHRFAALQKLYGMLQHAEKFDTETIEQINFVLRETDLAEDVTDIVDDYCKREDIPFDWLPFDDLESVFAGTRIEKYKEEIAEW
ncbi:ParB N-terminal domain-containing protein [Alicyclobacillus fastidiosus]|uniref:ParB N-terminal domain-containing protein n=1 Tax=Alicyclobacillus fastidiosus TaxID=392011 RepID=A0ABV5AHU9_9BACL|nr:ParB N-terminal domain-containing protein [Alicyclobacillus fastidiosus]WEH09189.1 ParB N-terminal domain-containing protein [Alicyclobacillus fastidiosus]